MTAPTWKNRITRHADVDPTALAAHPANWRVHPKHQADALAGVLSEVGYVQSVIVNERSGRIVDGHLRVALAVDRAEPTLPVVYVDLSDDEERLILATLDPIGALAETDTAALSALLDGLAPTADGLADLLASLRPEVPTVPREDPGAQIDRADELRAKWGCQVGQVWVLGDHRLAIGDCTDQQVIAVLMQGEMAGAVVTDPPYGIDQPGIENDGAAALPSLFANCLRVMPVENAAVIAFQSTRMFPVWLDAIRGAGHDFERMLWMYKPNDVTFPWRGWLLKSEAILVSTVGEASWLRVDPFAHDCYTSNWDSETKARIDGWHASIKPLPLIQDLVSRVGGLVYEPFSGSGTTLIACERLARPCRAIELTPGYAAVSIQRWADATGREPSCENAR